MMYDDIERVLYTEEQVNARAKEMAKQIAQDFKDEELVMVCILRGSCIFFAELVKHIPNYVELEFITVSSYGGTNSSGEVRLIADLSKPIQDKNVFIVEDIIDTGYTLNYLKRLLGSRNPKSLKIVTLLDKHSRRLVECEGDYVGYKVPNEFVVGYGLDFNQRYRNFPHIGVLKKEIYEEK